ncbi:hypothetical protein DL96DRAFT_1612141 [Flagelloscypha sp. PMI_526]|nr:hypothetical protein DL96DRAFT_1612141 [Flagelloscypha sp. PMI_526]
MNTRLARRLLFGAILIAILTFFWDSIRLSDSLTRRPARPQRTSWALGAHDLHEEGVRTLAFPTPHIQDFELDEDEMDIPEFPLRSYPSSTPRMPPSPQATREALSLKQRLSNLPDKYRPPPYGSETLGVFQRIWVVTLEGKQDRREHMNTLSTALELNFTYHFGRNPFSNGVDREIVEDIANYVHLERELAVFEEEQEINSSGRQKAFIFEWSDDASVGSSLPMSPNDLQGSDYWILPRSDPRKPTFPPRYPRYLVRPDGRGGLDDTQGRKAPKQAFADSEIWPYNEWELMDAPRIACWLSHYDLLRKIAESDEEGPQLILEDDVDLEWDIQQRLQHIWSYIPNWDVVYLGHCYSDGAHQPPLPGQPYLRHTGHVMCTHAYAIMPSAARKIVRYLRSPLFAFSRPIDHMFNAGLMPGLTVLLIEPAIAIQMPKDMLPSSIGTGEFKQWLVDSVVERIRREQSMERNEL